MYRLSVLILFFVCFHFSGFAQVYTTSDIDSTSQKNIIIRSIIIIGNNTTKTDIVTREITFNYLDTLTEAALHKKMHLSQQNLMNTGLFNFVDIRKLNIDSTQADIYVMLTERWYFWPIPLFEIADRNFNIWWKTKNPHHLNFGTYLIKYNFRGRRETLQAKIQFGFSQQFALQYDLPYLNKKQTLGMGFVAYVTRNHEIYYGSENNKLLFYRDDKNFVRKDFQFRYNFAYRPNIYNLHKVEMRYYNANVQDTITKIATRYFTNNTNKAQILTAAYNFDRDRRDYKTYALKGYRFTLDVSKIGFGLLKNENSNYTKIEVTAEKHQTITKKLNYAIYGKGKWTNTNDVPYYLQRGLGFLDVVRGYDYYVIDGQQFALFKNGFKYELFSNKKVELEPFKNDRFRKAFYAFYVDVFADAGYVSDNLYETKNKLANQWLYGYGAGIHFITIYDIVLRAEVARNANKETGFYINVGAPF